VAVGTHPGAPDLRGSMPCHQIGVRIELGSEKIFDGGIDVATSNVSLMYESD